MAVVLMTAAAVWVYMDNRRLQIELAKIRVDQALAESSADARAYLDQRLAALEQRSAAVATNGLSELPTPALMRQVRASFVEMYSYDDRGSSSYGTASHLGNGYFLTVKHGVVALGQEGLSDPRRIVRIKIAYNGKMLDARIIDSGDANVEVHPGDWAIIKVREGVDLPAVRMDLSFGFDFADPIFRLGNDYSKGMQVATGYIGQRTANGLITSLTDGHPGVSGGGVMNSSGLLIGIPVGRMMGDYRFSFILPLREEMFRKVPHLRR
jgi:S1-C subfamily serine protease